MIQKLCVKKMNDGGWDHQKEGEAGGRDEMSGDDQTLECLEYIIYKNHDLGLYQRTLKCKP